MNSVSGAKSGAKPDILKEIQELNSEFNTFISTQTPGEFKLKTGDLLKNDTGGDVLPASRNISVPKLKYLSQNPLNLPYLVLNLEEVLKLKINIYFLHHLS